MMIISQDMNDEDVRLASSLRGRQTQIRWLPATAAAEPRVPTKAIRRALLRPSFPDAIIASYLAEKVNYKIASRRELLPRCQIRLSLPVILVAPRRIGVSTIGGIAKPA
jgi:hypothetical protein